MGTTGEGPILAYTRLQEPAKKEQKVIYGFSWTIQSAGWRSKPGLGRFLRADTGFLRGDRSSLPRRAWASLEGLEIRWTDW
jgi:hypothetical protein